MNNYACMLYNGEGIDIDIPEATRLFKMAIEKGSSMAMNNYAYILQHDDINTTNTTK